MALIQRTDTKAIVVHGLYTRPDQDILIDTVRRWHVEERGWLDVGYHYLITRKGFIQEGREEGAIGAHVRGFNAYSIGIALAGGMHHTEERWDSNYNLVQYYQLMNLITRLEEKYGTLRILGHRDAPGATKECPGFDVASFVERHR